MRTHDLHDIQHIRDLLTGPQLRVLYLTFLSEDNDSRYLRCADFIQTCGGKMSK